jgi:hypothetical protein
MLSDCEFLSRFFGAILRKNGICAHGLACGHANPTRERGTPFTSLTHRVGVVTAVHHGVMRALNEDGHCISFQWWYNYPTQGNIVKPLWRIVMKRMGLVLPALTALAILGAVQAGDKKSVGEPTWVQLFNGKDLTGWKTHPDDKAKWEVKDGNIVGSGPAGHLFSERGDYENFHLKFEVKINDKGNSGQYFRAKFAKAFPPGYEAQINSTHGDKVRTGSLYADGRDKYSDAEKKKMLVFDRLVEPDTWFTQEVIADGNHIIIKVNGKTTVDFVDEKNRHTKGHFAIQQHDPGSVVTVRKIEMKELPPSKK